MNDIFIPKQKFKAKKGSNKVSKFFTKILLSIIFTLSCLIFSNISSKNAKLFKENLLNNNFHYNNLKKKYEKYLGKVLPKKNNNSKMVFKKESTPYKINKTDNGDLLTFDDKTVVEAFQSGIVVFIGDKDNLKNTIIIQGIDDIDIWYSNVTDSNLKLYDYVEKNSVIGEVDKELLINIYKNNNKIDYDQYIKEV